MRLKQVLISMLSVFWLITVVACVFSENDSHTDGVILEKTKLRLNLRPTALVKGEIKPLISLDSIQIRISADDIAPLLYTFSGDSLNLSLQDLPVGESRVVTAEMYRKGQLMYAGKGTYTFKKESQAELALQCLPQFSRVTTRFHIPVGLPMPIVDGSLKVLGKTSAFSAKLSKQGEFGIFSIEEIPGDAKYDVAMLLLDSTGKPRFEASRASVFLPKGEEAKWDLSLQPSDAQAAVALTLAPIKETQVVATFPTHTRKLLKSGEVVVSEFYAAPSSKDSSTAGEWFELFNRTADTLALSDCRFTRDRSVGITQNLNFDSLTFLPPGRAVVFGRSAAIADYHYSDFTLVNTSATLLLLCSSDKIVVDSLKYSATVDSTVATPNRPIQIKDGYVSSLDTDSITTRIDAHSWCLTKNGDGLTGLASPRQITSCHF